MSDHSRWSPEKEPPTLKRKKKAIFTLAEPTQHEESADWKGKEKATTAPAEPVPHSGIVRRKLSSLPEGNVFDEQDEETRSRVQSSKSDLYTWSDEDYPKPPSRSGLSGQIEKREELLSEAWWRKFPPQNRYPAPKAAMATPYAVRLPLPEHLQKEPEMKPIRDLLKEIERGQAPRGDKAVFFDPNELSPNLRKIWDKYAGRDGGGSI